MARWLLLYSLFNNAWATATIMLLAIILVRLNFNLFIDSVIATTRLVTLV